MTEYTFKVNLKGICDLDCFKEATKDEVKVLLAIASLGGECASVDNIAAMCGVSAARVMATVALFEESGVLVKRGDDFLAEVEFEFNSKENGKAKTKEIAASIRENDLYEMNREMERILEKTLETREIERITSLYTKNGLSVEYILMLSAHLKDKRQKLTVEYIVREATKLAAKDIDNLEALEVYIKEKNAEVAGEMEMRRLFGIYGRTLTKTERDHFSRWLSEFGYSSVIIGEAYDISVNATGKLSLPYIDSILSTWHTAGCKNLDECRAMANSKKHEKSKKANNSSHNKKKTVEAESPKYTDFNSEDALMRALERSYGED